MSENGVLKFEILFIEFLQKALINPKILEQNKLSSKFILQRLYFLERPHELQAAIVFLQSLKLLSSKVSLNISNIIDEVDVNLPHIIRQDHRKLMTTINDVKVNIQMPRRSAGRTMDATRNLL